MARALLATVVTIAMTASSFVAAPTRAASNAGLGTHQRMVSDPLFFAQELLGRPTDSQVTINAGAIAAQEIYYEYGVAPGNYTARTRPVTLSPGEPTNVLLTGLKADTQYYYRMRHRAPGNGEFTARPEHAFHTARAPGSAFTFVVQFDPHMDENTSEEVYRQSLRNMLADKPDFLIDLGDNSMGEKCAVVSAKGRITGIAKEDEGDMNVELTMDGLTWRSLKSGLDVKDQAKGRMRMSGKVDMDGVKAELDLEGPITIDGTAKLRKTTK